MTDSPTIDALELAAPAEQPGGARAYLVVREGLHTQVIDLAPDEEITIGRAAESTISLDDARVSREHARVRRRGGAIELEDLGSRNGTHVGSDRVRAATRRVGSGDVIRIGGAEIIVAVASGAPVGEGGGRLEAELKRVAAACGGRAYLVRLAVDPERGARALEVVGSLLGSMSLVEAQGPGEYAAVLGDPDPEVAEDLLARLARASGEVEVTFGRLPRDGSSAAELLARARAAAERYRGAGAAQEVPAEIADGVVVADADMVRVFRLARRVAPAPTTVLLCGETGVGKEVLAEQIHRWSPRAHGPFVRLNCASLPETLLESELFGHERGAFTGADRRKIGYLEASGGGTLLLDEIGELTPAMQVKLLRVLETRRLRHLGGTHEISIDVRLLAATHRDLQADVASGRFREDLYFRLSAFVIEVPPLRERPAEIALLADLFARDLARRMAQPPPVIDPAAMSALAGHRWPGNVRELRNAIEHALVMAEGGT